jgi:muramoyltetrapeptide carboxypeptidase LdcA involved in peptidoglycan recycling
MYDYTRSYFLKAACSSNAIGIIEPSPWWTEEFLDWREKKDEVRPRRPESSAGWSWLTDGCAEGVLIGGCIESLQHLRGTRFWPDWEGAILFFETSEEAPSPEAIDGILMDYENMGVLGQLSGLLVGRPMRYTAKAKEQLRQVIHERTRRYSFPVVTDMDFGHTAPQFTLPIGCRARIDAERRCFEVIEPAVSDDAAQATIRSAPRPE